MYQEIWTAGFKPWNYRVESSTRIPHFILILNLSWYTLENNPAHFVYFGEWVYGKRDSLPKFGPQESALVSSVARNIWSLQLQELSWTLVTNLIWWIFMPVPIGRWPWRTTFHEKFVGASTLVLEKYTKESSPMLLMRAAWLEEPEVVIFFEEDRESPNFSFLNTLTTVYKM